MVFLTKTCSKDLQWLNLSVKTAHHYAKEPLDWYVVGDNDCMVELVALSKLYPGITWHLSPVQDRWPELMSMGGYYAQQGVKLLAHRFVDTGYFLVVDSDLLFQKPFTSASFIGEHKPIYWYSDFNVVATGDRVNQMAHWGRRDLLTNLFNRADINYEMMRCLPIWLNSEVLRKLESSSMWPRIMQLMAESNPAFSEFNIYGSYAYFYFPSFYDWRNAETQGPTFGHLSRQGWSWENPSQEILDTVGAL